MVVLNLPFKALMFLTLMRPSLVLLLAQWLKLAKNFWKVRRRRALLPLLSSCCIWLGTGRVGDQATVRGARVRGVLRVSREAARPRSRLVGEDGVLGLEDAHPALPPGDRVNGVEVAVPRAGIDRPRHLDRLRGDRVLGGEEPCRGERAHRGRVERGPSLAGARGVVLIGRPVHRPDRDPMRDGGAGACRDRRTGD